MKNKKALSPIIATILMIALVLAAITIIWRIVDNLLEENIEESQSCFGIFDKAEINYEYTCYNSTSGELYFSINIKDLNLTKMLISVASDVGSKSYTLTNQMKTIPGLLSYPNRGNQVVLPSANSGLTYISTDFSEKPDSIKIAPIVNDDQCEISDAINGIEYCEVQTP